MSEQADNDAPLRAWVGEMAERMGVDGGAADQAPADQLPAGQGGLSQAVLAELQDVTRRARRAVDDRSVNEPKTLSIWVSAAEEILAAQQEYGDEDASPLIEEMRGALEDDAPVRHRYESRGVQTVAGELVCQLESTHPDWPVLKATVSLRHHKDTFWNDPNANAPLAQQNTIAYCSLADFEKAFGAYCEELGRLCTMAREDRRGFDPSSRPLSGGLLQFLSDTNAAQLAASGRIHCFPIETQGAAHTIKDRDFELMKQALQGAWVESKAKRTTGARAWAAIRDAPWVGVIFGADCFTLDRIYGTDGNQNDNQ